MENPAAVVTNALPLSLETTTTVTKEAEVGPTMEAAQAAADGTMMIDHITEMAIVTAMDKTAAVAEVAAGRRPTVKGTTVGIAAVNGAIPSTTIPVGRNRLGTVETADTAVAVAIGATTAVETGATVETVRRRTTGPYRCHGTIGSSRSCFRAATGHRVSTLTATRISRWRPLALTCRTASKISVR